MVYLFRSEALTDCTPDKLLGDKANDSGKPDEKLLEERGVEIIAPRRKGREMPKTRDGRKRGSFRRRRNAERLYAWLQNFRRLVVRYEYHAENFPAMVRLGCVKIIIRLF